jgi:hypothetical protein
MVKKMKEFFSTIINEMKLSTIITLIQLVLEILAKAIR